MEKEFVAYELAVKLKALGFDEDVFEWFNTETKDLCDVMKEVKAPLYQQAFRWFDENTELKGFVCPSIKEEHFDWLIRIDWEEEIECEEAYPSRQEAELACLTKLIEIVEQSKN